jgi:glucans biosynthesis protein
MNRRDFLEGGSAFVAVALHLGAVDTVRAQDATSPVPAQPFDHKWLLEEARRLASGAYEEPAADLPPELAELGYDQYRDIRYKSEARIWAGEPTRFQLDLLHRGFIFRDHVRIAIVEQGKATPLRFSPALFDYGDRLQPPSADARLDFSGFRVRNPINGPDVWDEFAVFQGASYFRAVGRGHVYGISARGLAINTAEPDGEEFPSFRSFWIEKPAPGQDRLVVHALLDSPSTTGAYRFVLTPGAETIMQVEGVIFPRVEIAKVGVAPLTSMFWFDPTNRAGVDDFRSAVHDSDGLQMLTGAGEWLWRPLANPRELQMSVFKDGSPQGFGLMQRARRYEDYHDLEAHYGRRPSLWIEPIGDWGAGSIELVEIPTENEINDNIVAYWRPDGAVRAGEPWRFAYRMRWTDAVEPRRRLLVTKSTRAGLANDRNRRLFVIDFAAEEEVTPQGLTMEVSASSGEIVNSVIHRAQPEDAVRVSFELAPGSERNSELRLRLLRDSSPVSETWLYRWTAG